MQPQTRHHLETVFLEVSRAAARKKIYALRAEQDRKQQLSRLFQAMAISEDAQARRFLLQLRGQTQKTKVNCITAFEEEIPELIARYNDAAETATKDGERAMELAFFQSARVERMHLHLYKTINKTERQPSYHICSFCGFIKEEQAPDRCPICTTIASRFVEE
jgi:rubrerythrin